MAAGLDLGGHPRELVPHRLELGDGTAELLALPRVADRDRQALLGEPHALGGEQEALEVEVLHDVLEPRAGLADQAVGADATVAQVHRGGLRGVPAHLVEVRPHLEAGGAAVDGEETDALARVLGAGLRSVEEEVGEW